MSKDENIRKLITPFLTVDNILWPMQVYPRNARLANILKNLLITHINK